MSGLFFVLTLRAYERYARRAQCRQTKLPELAEEGRIRGKDGIAATPDALRLLRSALSLSSYWLVVLLFVMGLMTKPMLVTLPLILLLLDYWPLRRCPLESVDWRTWRELVIEKLPFFALAAASCVVTVLAQQNAGPPLEILPLPPRINNAMVASMTYVGQMFWPAHLAILYPFRIPEPRSVILSLVLLAFMTTGTVLLRRSHPYLWTGWWWYLIMLLPVAGLVQVGAQARADRYTYLPQIGLLLAFAWLAADLGGRWPGLRAVKGCLASALPLAGRAGT